MEELVISILLMVVIIMDQIVNQIARKTKPSSCRRE